MPKQLEGATHKAEPVGDMPNQLAHFRCDEIPQGLKPLSALASIGTAEAVP